MQTKSTILVAVFMCTAVMSKAQISKGNTLLGGNFNFSSTSEKGISNDNTYTSFTITPSLGWAYKDNKVFGILVSYTYTGTKQSYDLNTSSFGGGAYLRQYKPLGKAFYFFAQESLRANYIHTKNITSYAPAIEDEKGTAISVQINPGIAYDLNKRIQFEFVFFNNLLSAGYVHTKYTFNNQGVYYDYKESNFNLAANTEYSSWTSVNLGAKIFFGR